MDTTTKIIKINFYLLLAEQANVFFAFTDLSKISEVTRYKKYPLTDEHYISQLSK